MSTYQHGKKCHEVKVKILCMQTDRTISNNKPDIIIRDNDVAGHRPATSWVHCITSCNTQSSSPEDGQNKCPKHVGLIGIINKLLLLHVVGCLYYLNQ